MRSTGRPAAILRVSALVLIAGGLVHPASAPAQMSIGSTTGVVPDPIYHSLLLAGDQASFQNAWANPSNVYEQFWRDDINSRANQSPSGTVPGSFGTAAVDSSIAHAAGLRYAMTGSESDRNKAVSALRRADVPDGTTITRPEVILTYLMAYDYIRGAPLNELSQATRDEIETRLLSLTNSLGNGMTDSNAKAKIGGTRGLAGVLLRDQALLDQGLSDLQAHFNYSTTDDGWFTDSQGHYLNYTMRHIAAFTRAYEQGSGVDLYPHFQPYIEMSIALRKPDGREPNVSNGLNSPVALNLFSQTTNPEAASLTLWALEGQAPNYISNVINNDWHYTAYFGLTDFSNVTAAPPTTSPTFLATGQSKVSVFRHDWGPTSDYLLLSPGIDSPPFELEILGEPYTIPAFHTHNDTAEILLSARGEYLLVAPGYNRTDLTESPPGFLPQQSDWHNVVLVDGTLGSAYPTDTFGNQGRTMRPEDFVHTNRLDSTERGGFRGVGDFATLKTSYADADVTRSIAFANEDYFVVADRMRSDSTREYGFNLVGRGTQTVLTDEPDLVQVKWELNDAQVIEHLFSTGDLTLTTASLHMHDEFDQFEVTQRMTGSISAQEGGFLSVLETGAAGSVSQLALARLSTGDDHLAVQVAHTTAGWTDTILAQDQSTSRVAGELGSDGTYAYLRTSGSEVDSLMMAEGTWFSALGDLLFTASDSLTLSLLFDGANVLGTISDDGLTAGTELRLMRSQIVSATLDDEPLAFANQTGFGTLYIPSGGALRVEVLAVPEPASLLLLALGLPALWHLGRRSRRRSG